MPSVSVIIPAFNAAATLSATLESILQQTLADWEAIIVDDGSTDFTASNAMVWCGRDPRFKLIGQRNLGPSAARNQGARNANAPWLLFLDADDLISADHLASLTATVAESPETDLAYSGWTKIATDGRIGTTQMPPAEHHFERLAAYNIFCIHECLVRRDIFRDVGGFDTTLSTCEEWDLWQRLARSGAKFTPAGGGLALYRMRAESLSHRPDLLFKGASEVIRRGHRPDPRVLNPVQAYANGAAAEKLPQALMYFALWCGGLLIGSGKNPSDFLLNVPLTEVGEFDRDGAVSAIEGSVPAGACAVQADWSRLWPRLRRTIYDAYKVVEQRCGIPNFADQCMEELQRRLQWLWVDESPSVPKDKASPDSEPLADDSKVQFGDFWRLEPIGKEWGYDRGDPIDRMYIESFLQRHCEDIRGRVLEAGDDSYTNRFGGDRVTRKDVIHVSPECKTATIVADLASGDHIPSDSFDCIILTQTLHLIFDLRSAVRTIERILKPGGTLLLTVPGISQMDYGEWAEDWHWSMTVHSVRRLLSERFPPESVEVESRGNVLSATAFLQGLSQQDIGDFGFQIDDPHYPLTVLARATKPAAVPAKTSSRSKPSKSGSAIPTKSGSGEPPIILMYHRVDIPKHDPWLLRVSRENLSEQLQLLSAERDIVPLPWLISKLSEGTVPQGTACLTFDDGYADVLNNGRPLLEKHGCPATIFLPTQYIGSDGGFWWDILVRIMFETSDLPAQLTLRVAGVKHTWQLESPSGSSADNAVALADLHLELWKLLKPLSSQERHAALEQLALWAGTDAAPRPADRTVSLEEVSRLIEPGFIDVGAHSLTHPSLPLLAKQEMEHEIVASRNACEELFGAPVRSFAYPFGDVDETTASTIRAAGFELACTTIGGAVTLQQDRMHAPRIFVGNWGAEEFERKVLYSHKTLTTGPAPLQP
jgi:glycosyltransferase involved in cell wall biosynthesis/peptidoglycan/xylan/chitin deacetylase (PgdA/CDA1 family)